MIEEAKNEHSQPPLKNGWRMAWSHAPAVASLDNHYEPVGAFSSLL